MPVNVFYIVGLAHGTDGCASLFFFCYNVVFFRTVPEHTTNYVDLTLKFLLTPIPNRLRTLRST